MVTMVISVTFYTKMLHFVLLTVGGVEVKMEKHDPKSDIRERKRHICNVYKILNKRYRKRYVAVLQ
jgi:hypothetical protein